MVYELSQLSRRSEERAGHFDRKFAHDLWYSQIEYLSNSIDLIRKDRAKRNHKSSIFNRQYSIPACPGWVLPDKTSRA